MNAALIFHQTVEPTPTPIVAALLSANAVSRYRVRAIFGSDPVADPLTLDPLEYSFSRQDGGPVDFTVLSIAEVGGVALDLNLDDTIVPEVIYVLSWSTYSVTFSFHETLFVSVFEQELSDPEAEIFGRDVAWLQGSLGADGDIPQRKGIACLKNDLFAVGFLRPGDLAQYPDRGANIQATVNGVGDDNALQEIASSLDREWLADDRIVESSALPSTNSDGNAIISGKVRTASLQESIKIG